MTQLQDLSHYTGTAEYVRHPLVPSILLTDGARALADSRGAWWLLDIIATEGADMIRRRNDECRWQAWKMTVHADTRRADIAVDDGNGRQLHRRAIRWTDYPEPSAELWLIDNVILLPSEY